jgi:hypothetical protein
MNHPDHAKEYLVTMRQLEPLFRQCPAFASMQFDDLCDHVAFFWNCGTIAWVISDEGKASAVCMIKLFRKLHQFLFSYIHDPCGKFCMIDVLVAEEPNAWAWVCEELIRRWGPQEIMLWDRGERTENGAPRMYKWDQFLKLTHRATQGVFIEKDTYGKLC